MSFLTPRLTGLLKQYGKKHTKAENFILIFGVYMGGG